MIIVLVTFKIPEHIELDLIKEKFLETAPLYLETKGLLRKNYIADIEDHTAGGIYCFDTRENAKSWFDADRIAWLTDRYSAPDVRYFDSPVIVDNQHGKIVS